MRAGRILAAILLVTGLLGVSIGAGEVYTRLLYIALLFIAVSWVWTRLSLFGMRIKRRARSLRASVGDVFEEHFELSNDSFLAKLWVEIANDSSIPGAAGSRLLTRIGGKKTRTYIGRTWLIRRGGFSLGPTRLVSGDPFGLFRIQKAFPSLDSLVVFPIIHNLTSFLSPPGLLPGGQVIRRKAVDITPHASGVREYTPGDPMKRIHWPTTARRGQLVVKEFEQDPQAEVWLFLDAQAKVHAELPYQLPETQVEIWALGRRPKFGLPPSTLEYAISIAASLANYFIKQRRAVGLVTANRSFTVIPTDRSERQEYKILETLAFLEGKGSLSLAGLVAAQAGGLPKGSSVILITPSAYPELLAAVDDLQRRSLRPVLIHLMAESFGGSSGGEQVSQSLIERGVSVCQIYNGDDLTKTLSEFSPSSRSQDMTWLRPPLPHLT